MRRWMFGLAATALLLAGAGCATIEMSSKDSLKGVDIVGANGRAQRTVSIDNEGYYLFWILPLVGGDIRWDAERGELRDSLRWFHTMNSVQDMTDALFAYADSENCDVIHVDIYDKSDAGIGLLGVQEWVRTICGLKKIRISAVLCARDTERSSK